MHAFVDEALPDVQRFGEGPGHRLHQVADAAGGVVMGLPDDLDEGASNVVLIQDTARLLFLLTDLLDEAAAPSQVPAVESFPRITEVTGEGEVQPLADIRLDLGVH